MTKDHAQALIQNYINGWRENNMRKIVESLTDNCVIIESHGPMYKGRLMVEKWVEQWVRRGNFVEEWRITSLYFTDESCFVEWTFSCTSEGIHESFEGASIVEFKNEKIFKMREYRTTTKLFEWQPID